VKTLLVILTGFVGCTAIVCGSLLILQPDGNTMQLSPDVLTGTPFQNFIIPGIILFTVGVCNFTAFISIKRRQNTAFTVSLLAGLFTIGWIVVQIILTGVLFWLQFVYLAAGMLIILISFQLKGRLLI
jgi:hypothetical protein